MRPSTLPEAPPARDPATDNAAETPEILQRAEKATITASPKDSRRLIGLIQHDIRQHGGQIIEVRPQDDGSATTIKAVAPDGYAHRIHPMDDEARPATRRATQEWARSAISTADSHGTPSGEGQAAITITVRSEHLTNPAERNAALASAVAIIASIAAATSVMVAESLMRK